MTLSYRNGVSIAEIAVYVPSLFIAAFLAFRHGLGRNSGWLFLIIFCLARILGPCMELATISNPTNSSLYIGAAILQNIALSPLMLATIGLLNRLLDSIHKNKQTVLHTTMFRLLHLIIVVGLVLGIVGGTDAANNYSNSGFRTYTPSPLNKAGTALFVVSYIAIVALTVIMSFHVSAAEKGEKRLFLAVAISLPLLLVRLVYSIIANFTKNKSFNLLQGSITVVLCMALIEEFIVVAVFEGTGLSLKKAEKHVYGTQQLPSRDSSAPRYQQKQDARVGQAATQEPKKENMALKIAKMTIIGRLITAAMASKNPDTEMQ